MPHGGSHYELVASIKECLNNYTYATKKSLVFDKSKHISAKDMRGYGELFKVLPTMTSPSQVISTDAIMKSKSNW